MRERRGWSNRALIEILAEVLPVDIDLVVLPVQVDAVSDGWQREWRHALEQALDRSVRRVEVRALEGNQGEPGRPGEPVLTSAVQRALARLRGQYRRGLVVLCDVGFSGAAARSTANAAWTTVFDIDETHKYATWADFRHPGTPSRDFDD